MYFFYIILFFLFNFYAEWERKKYISYSYTHHWWCKVPGCLKFFFFSTCNLEMDSDTSYKNILRVFFSSSFTAATLGQVNYTCVCMCLCFRVYISNCGTCSSIRWHLDPLWTCTDADGRLFLPLLVRFILRFFFLLPTLRFIVFTLTLYPFTHCSFVTRFRFLFPLPTLWAKFHTYKESERERKKYKKKEKHKYIHHSFPQSKSTSTQRPLEKMPLGQVWFSLYLLLNPKICLITSSIVTTVLFFTHLFFFSKLRFFESRRTSRI